MKIFLIRHGESEANAKGTHQGQRIDTKLSNIGLEQAKKVAQELKDKKIDAVYSSDLLRARQTAEIIAREHKIQIKLDKRLREFDTGDFTGVGNWLEKFHKYKNEEAENKNIKRYEVSAPNGESEWQHYLRSEEFLNDLVKDKKNENKTIVVVAHGGTNKIMFGVIKHATRETMYQIPQTNCCINEMDYDPKSNKWKVHRINNDFLKS